MSNNKLTAIIPINKIKKIRTYENTKRKSLSAIMQETGADYGMNGTIYTANWKPCADTKIDGNVKFTSGYSEWGAAWNEGPDIQFCVVPTQAQSYQNYITCKGFLVNKAVELYALGELDGVRGRTAIGFTDDSLVLYCSKDGTSSAISPKNLAEELRDSFGCINGIMLDGGKSSQCSFDGDTVTSLRVVQNVILIWVKDEGVKLPKFPNPYSVLIDAIRFIQFQLKNRFGYSVEESGTVDDLTIAALKSFKERNRLYTDNPEDVDVITLYALTDELHSLGCETCPWVNSRVGSTIEFGHVSNSVKWLQWHLSVKFHYQLQINGRFQNEVLICVKDFQQKHGLDVDGIAGPSTQDMILSAVN